MRIELAIACTRSAQNLVSVQVIRLSARCDVSFPKGYATIWSVTARAPSSGISSFGVNVRKEASNGAEEESMLGCVVDHRLTDAKSSPYYGGLHAEKSG
jgi:hypothetical protein